MKYQTLTAVLEALSDGRSVRSADVASRVLNCRVWVAGVGQPGCLYDSGPDYFRTKADAIAHLVFIADDGERVPRGIVTSLKHYGSFSEGYARYELSRDTLGSLLS